MRAVDLTASTRDLLAPVCRDCVWWQSVPGSACPPGLRNAWENEVQAEAGFFGRALVDGSAVIGWMHAAASHLVPRARCLPSGPPSADAYLLICSYFYDQDYLHGFQILLQEMEAALKHRRVKALEAFGLRRTGSGDPFRGYIRELNLFHPEVLEGSGFRPVQAKGEVVRLRLELSTLVVAPRYSVARERIEAGATAQPVWADARTV